MPLIPPNYTRETNTEKTASTCRQCSILMSIIPLWAS